MNEEQKIDKMNDQRTPQFSDDFSDVLQWCEEKEGAWSRFKIKEVANAYDNVIPDLLLPSLEKRNQVAKQFALEEGERALAFFKDGKSHKGIVLTSDAIITSQDVILRDDVSSVSVTYRTSWLWVHAVKIHVGLHEGGEICLRLRNWERFAPIVEPIFKCWQSGSLSDDIRQFQQWRKANKGIKKGRDRSIDEAPKEMTASASSGFGYTVFFLAALYFGGHYVYQKCIGKAAEELLQENGLGGLKVETVSLPIDAPLSSKTEATLLIGSGAEIATITMEVIGYPWEKQWLQISGDQMFKLRARGVINNLLSPRKNTQSKNTKTIGVATDTLQARTNLSERSSTVQTDPISEESSAYGEFLGNVVNSSLIVSFKHRNGSPIPIFQPTVADGGAWVHKIGGFEFPIKAGRDEFHVFEPGKEGNICEGSFYYVVVLREKTASVQTVAVNGCRFIDEARLETSNGQDALILKNLPTTREQGDVFVVTYDKVERKALPKTPGIIKKTSPITGIGIVFETSHAEGFRPAFAPETGGVVIIDEAGDCALKPLYSEAPRPWGTLPTEGVRVQLRAVRRTFNDGNEEVTCLSVSRVDDKKTKFPEKSNLVRPSSPSSGAATNPLTTAKPPLQLAEEMVGSYTFDMKTGVSTFTVPAGVTDIEAMKAINEYFRKNLPSFERDAVYAGDLEWFENLPKEFPNHCKKRDYSQARQITITGVVKGTKGELRTTQGSVLTDDALVFSDPRDQAIAAALHACKHDGEDLFKDLWVRGSVPGFALRTVPVPYFGVYVSRYDVDYDLNGVAASGSPSPELK